MSIELTFKYDVSPTPGALELQFGEASNFLKFQGASHRHVVTSLPKLVPEARASSTTHAVTSTTLTFDPASILSPLKNLDAKHKHHARDHFIRLDFVYNQQTHDVIQNHVRLDFNPELPRQVHPIGHTAPDWDRWGLPETRNLAQAFYPVGLQNEQVTRYGVHFVSPFVAQINLTWRAAPDDPATLPLLLDFQEGNDALPVHNARQLQVTAQCDVGLVIPLVVQHAAQEQVADHTRVILPINAASTQHVHTADHVRVALPVRANGARQEQTATQPALTHTSPLQNLNASQIQTAVQIWIRHTIPLVNIDNTIAAHFAENTYVIHRPPARAHSTSHWHMSDNIVVTHISPLVINNAAQQQVPDHVIIRNWSGVIPASSAQQHTAEHLLLYVFAVLLAADTRHLMRSMRLNFLPADWVFRAILDIEPETRVLAIEAEDRSLDIEYEGRVIEIEYETRELTIPAEDRTIELEPEGRAAPVER